MRTARCVQYCVVAVSTTAQVLVTRQEVVKGPFSCSTLDRRALKPTSTPCQAGKDYTYRFTNGIPNQITQLAYPDALQPAAAADGHLRHPHLDDEPADAQPRAPLRPAARAQRRRVALVDDVRLLIEVDRLHPTGRAYVEGPRF